MVVVINVLKVIALAHNSNVMVHLNVQISQMKLIVESKKILADTNVLKDIVYLLTGSVMELINVQINQMNKIAKLKHLPPQMTQLKPKIGHQFLVFPQQWILFLIQLQTNFQVTKVKIQLQILQ